MGMFDAINPWIDRALDLGTTIWQQQKAEGMQHSAQAFAAEQSAGQMAFQERMRGTQYQTAVEDMRKAGLNPMLAYHQGGAGTPQGSAVAGPGGSPATHHPSRLTEAMHSAAQVELMKSQAENIQADTDLKREQAGETSERAATHAPSIEVMKQRIQESISNVEKIIQETKTSAASAAHLNQQVSNLKEMVPQIRATVHQLRALTQQSTATTSEIRQRVSANLPALERELMALERTAAQMAQPGHAANEAAQESFIGHLGAYLRALLPIQGIMGAIPLGKFGGGRSVPPKYKPAGRDYSNPR